MQSKNDQQNTMLFSDGVGKWCHDFAHQLWPITRSLTGPGTRETLTILGSELPNLKIHEIASGESAFDWTVPDEWTIREAYIEYQDGTRIADFKINNLHVLGYSEPVDTWLTLEELDKHLYSLPGQPDAIPYVTSYYKRCWGFCISQNDRGSLKAGKYRVYIDADLSPGTLNYADLAIPGKTKEEIFLSTYICHPSMANNELSGPVVTAALSKWISATPERRYTYRITIPETIGSIVYLSRHLDTLKTNVYAGSMLPVSEMIAVIRIYLRETARQFQIMWQNTYSLTLSQNTRRTLG